jgi:hypothetical protein
MKKADLRKKLSERSPLSSSRPIITPVDLYDVPKEDEKKQEIETGEKSHNRTFAQSHQNTINRVSRGYKFREDIIKDMKNLATNSNKKLYEVMEEAMLDYLKKHHT